MLTCSRCVAVDDLLADFRSPGHTGPSEELLGELLLPLSPLSRTGARTGSADDALAGLAAPRPPSTGPAASAQPVAAQPPPSAFAAAQPQPSAFAAAQPQPSAFGGAAAAAADPLMLGDLQYSGGSPLSGGGMGSGSIQSYDTPTSTGQL